MASSISPIWPEKRMAVACAIFLKALIGSPRPDEACLSIQQYRRWDQQLVRGVVGRALMVKSRGRSALCQYRRSPYWGVRPVNPIMAEGCSFYPFPRHEDRHRAELQRWE